MDLNQKSLHPVLSSSSSSETSNQISPDPTGGAGSGMARLGTADKPETPKLKPFDIKIGAPKNLETPVPRSGPATPFANSSVKKTGLRLGINVLGGNKPFNLSTPQPQSFDTPTALPKEEVAQSGLSSPIVLKSTPLPGSPSRQVGTDNPDLTHVPTTSPQPTALQDVASPPTTPKRSSVEVQNEDDLSNNLRMLAAKEMDVLEIGQKIKEMIETKRAMERDLERLKKKVERALVEQMQSGINSSSNASKGSRPNFFNLPGNNSGNGSRSPLRPRSQSPVRRNLKFGGRQNSGYSENSEYSNNETKGWGNNLFSKPLNFFQQFDTIIQNEFEKLHIPTVSEDKERESSSRGSSSSSFDNLEYSKEINEPIKSLAHNNSRSQEVVNSMTNQLWSFVNEVKSNLLSHDDSDDSPETQRTFSPGKLRSGNNANLAPTSPIQNRTRTPSVSNRTHYGQYSRLHKKRSNASLQPPEVVADGREGHNESPDGFANVVITDDGDLITVGDVEEEVSAV
ncbi:unnamed protein product [Kuraishia capsulata CBS 1993]|uniref:Topoisomerase I damage affected protein 11 n=1 Tax=Kuraishia capsulata CBS 1993 TaxID=1382522 RepID=W6MTV1_9ASCO|nr:uncharacterized protein KUCA_T00001227001 [Kuraishia capsulata CBS 1993]CDK25260.1 unnamed protein product [Kuraishia capsulata CBS 1993]